MTKHKLFGVISAALVIIFGFIYLKVGSSFLPTALIAISGAILLMGVFSALDSRSKGEKGLASLIPAICLFVLSAAVLAVWVYVMMK